MKILFFILLPFFAFGQDFASIARESAAITDIRLSREVASDIMIRPSDWNITPAKYAVKPGDRLILTGDRYEIELHDLVGTPDKPIILTALSKTVVKALNPGGRVIQFINCQYVRVTGDPDGTGAVNIFINGGGQAVDFRDLSSHVEADHLDITTGYSGINAKTDPTCDPKTWRGNFTLDGVYVHHCRITTKTGEGVYIGESHYHTVGKIQGGPCANGITTAQEHEVKNVIVEYNVITSTGADGIQVGSCPSGTTQIRYNFVSDYGTVNGFGQNAGIIANPGTVAEIYLNTITTGTGFGIQSQGPGGSSVHNNVVINAGTTNGGGVMTVNYMPNGKVDQVFNNTFLNTGRIGVEYYNELDFRSNILNTKAGIPFYKQGGAAGKLTKSVPNIELSGDPAQLKLDASYMPTKDSPAWGPTADAGALQSVKVRRYTGDTWEASDSLGVVKVWLISADGLKIRIK